MRMAFVCCLLLVFAQTTTNKGCHGVPCAPQAPVSTEQPTFEATVAATADAEQATVRCEG